MLEIDIAILTAVIRPVYSARDYGEGIRAGNEGINKAERAGNNEETCRKNGVSNQTFYRWKKMYGGMEASDIKRVRELEEENRKALR